MTDPQMPTPEPDDATQVAHRLGFQADDRDALDALAAAGFGEGDFGSLPGVPADALEAWQAMEWANAVAHAQGLPLPHPEVGVPPPDPLADGPVEVGP